MYHLSIRKIPTQEEIQKALCSRHSARVQQHFNAARVAIFGLGGLGSNVAFSLARIGIGHLHLIDFDVVDLANLNRQQYRIGHLGLYKTEALKMQIMEINPYLHIHTDTLKVTEDNAPALMADAHIICEAFDDPQAKSMLANALFEHFPEKKFVAASGMAGFESSNLMQVRKIARNFYLCGDNISIPKEENGLLSPRVSICAGQEANMIVRLILGEESP